jgi:radical SAM protein with 4Fe4S-binding SPASM domain
MSSKRERAKVRLPLVASTASHTRHVSLDQPSRHVDRRTRPIHAVWELTLACDLGCTHCGSRAGRARPDELSRAEALDLVAQLAALGGQEVTYLSPHFLDVVRAVRAHQMSSVLVTGDRQLDAARARAAAQAGIESVSVSIDGDLASHGTLRGLEGAYDPALAALGHARDAGLMVALNTQVNRRSLRCLEHVGALLVVQGCHALQLILTVPAGRAADVPDLVLQPRDLLGLFPRIAQLAEHCERHGIKLLPGNNVGYFGLYEHRLRRSLRSASQVSCAAGRLVIGIEANGDIKGCPSLPTRGWVGGNVRDHSLADIWERAEALRFIRDRNGSELWGYCARCDCAEVCRAGCTWTSTSVFGRPGNNPYCHHRALELAKEGLAERLVRVSEPPGDGFDYARWEIALEPLAPLETP